MHLDERKKIILKAIIDNYIKTAEPVGSRSISKKHEIGVSSATIRNEMADLEEMGFLEQPHTSAGRIPSSKGYRLYVDELMNQISLTKNEIIALRGALNHKVNELEHLIKSILLVLSQLTNYTSVGSISSSSNHYISSVQIVAIDKFRILVVVIFEGNIIKNGILRFGDIINAEEIVRLSNLINQKVSGVQSTIAKSIIDKLSHEIKFVDQKIVENVIVTLIDCIEECERTETYKVGVKNIFNHSEFKDIERAKEFMDLLEENFILSKLLSAGDDYSEVKIIIGSENEMIEVRDCSILTFKFSIGDINMANIGIIGPTRMDYPKIVALLSYLKNSLNKDTKKNLGE